MFMLFGSLTAIVNWFILYPAILLPAYAYLMVIAIVCTLIVLEATWVLFQKPPSPNKTVWLIVTMSITGVMTLLALYWFFDTIKYFVFPYFLNLLACGVMTAGVIIKAINEGLFGSGGGGGRRRYRDDDYDDRDDRDYDRRDNRRERDVDDRRDDRRGRDYDDRDDRDSREGRRRDRY